MLLKNLLKSKNEFIRLIGEYLDQINKESNKVYTVEEIYDIFLLNKISSSIYDSRNSLVIISNENLNLKTFSLNNKDFCLISHKLGFSKSKINSTISPTGSFKHVKDFSDIPIMEFLKITK